MDNKTPVVTLVQRGGEVRSQIMRRVTGAIIGKRLLRKSVTRLSTPRADSAHLNGRPGKQFARQESVNHRTGEYVRGFAHINTAEDYFGQLKRSMDGTHHHISADHVHRYLSEFDFRYRTRKTQDGERTMLAIRNAEGKRLRYRDSFPQHETVAHNE